MTLLRDIVSAFGKAPAQRPSQTPIMGAVASAVGSGAAMGTLRHLQTYSASGVLFSVVSRISEDIADTEWTLNRQANSGDMTEIDRHPFLDLWTSPNPYMTQFEFMEASQQHMELAGEIWWLYVDGDPPELWPLRPDRMRPVPHPRDFIQGYIYTIGNERVPLEVDQVIFVRRPNPLDAYRGIGPVGSMLLDIEGEQAAAQWNRQFFRNSAEPGGVIELEEELSDTDWDKFVRRWQQQHQGVSNAHRVAVLERGKWVERKFTQRDMQFEQLRRFNRDLILEAYGVNKSVMGIVEDVNRANAEAGEVNFARRVLRPRLTRLAGVINKRLLPRFGEGLVLEYVDPTPEDREFNLREAVEGYKGQVLKLNEARRRLGEEDETPEKGGDDYFKPVAADPFGGFGGGNDQGDEEEEGDEEDGDTSRSHVFLPIRSPIHGLGRNRRHDSVPWDSRTGGARGFLARQNDPLLPDPLEEAELAIQRGWRRRLERELRELLEFVAERMDKGFGPYVKIELSDLDGYDWDWWTRYGDEVAAELARAFQVVLTGAMPTMALPRAQELAAQFAQHRSAQLLRLDGTENMVAQTRERVRNIIANAITEGEGIRSVRDKIRDDITFSRRRAETVARTETRIALGQGQKGAAVEQGRDEKRWVTQGATDPRVDPVCLANEAQGWIAIGDPFQGGVDTVPQHPNCLCTVIYRTSEVHAISTPQRPMLMEPEEKRCPECNAVLMLNIKGEGLYCSRCKKELPWPEGETGQRVVFERDGYGRISGVRRIGA